MTNYQFRLTPVGHFFFGGEKHDNEGESINYFVESNPYPQQTTMLGLVRYYLLLINNLVGTDKIKIEGKDLIGEKSFDFDAGDQLFGKIESLSSLYFVNNQKKYFPAPFDIEYSISLDNGFYCFKKTNEKYSSKEGLLPLKVVDSEGNIGPSIFGTHSLANKLEEEDFIVFPSQHTGNEKGESGVTKEDAYYKQVFMKMKPNWSFAFDVDLKEELNENEINKLIYLNFGGEKSLFILEIKKVDKATFKFNKLLNSSSELAGFYCLSDCFIKDFKDINKSCFAANRSVSFRNFQSSVNTNNYAVYNKNDPDGMIRGNRFNLLSRGSVFYFKTKEERDEALKAFHFPHCIKIGFNNIVKIN